MSDDTETNLLTIIGPGGTPRDPEVPERLVQRFLSENLELLNLGPLQLIALEHPVRSGRIDILAEGVDRTRFVIEIKKGNATRDAVGQLQSYVGDLLIEEPSRTVRGCLVALGMDAPARAALVATPTIEFWSYRTLFAFSRVPVDRPKPAAPPPPPPPPPSCEYCRSLELGVLRDDGRTYCRKCGSFQKKRTSP